MMEIDGVWYRGEILPESMESVSDLSSFDPCISSSLADHGLTVVGFVTKERGLNKNKQSIFFGFIIRKETKMLVI